MGFLVPDICGTVYLYECSFGVKVSNLPRLAVAYEGAKKCVCGGGGGGGGGGHTDT